MNIVDKLLKIDAGKLELPKKDIKLKLGKLGGEEFVFPCRAIDPERFSEIQENAIELKKGEIKKMNMYEMKILTIIDGCPDVFKNKELLEHFGAITGKQLINKLMLSGEIDDLNGEISKLSGYDKDEEEKVENDIKNS